VAKVIPRRDLINAVALLMDSDVAGVAKYDLVIERDLTIEANVTNSIHVLVKLRLPSQFCFFQPSLYCLVLRHPYLIMYPFRPMVANDEGSMFVVCLG
jgi:hypothetical protein